MQSPIYVLDANVFIEAARRYYAFQFDSPFWENLIRLYDEGRIISIDRVKNEIQKGKDELADWVSNDFHAAFVSTDDDEVISSYAQIMNWVYNQDQYTIAAKAEFANSPDGWLIAYALAKGCIIVTHESFSKDAKKRVLIPNVCKHFGIECIDTFEMMKRLGVKLRS